MLKHSQPQLQRRTRDNLGLGLLFYTGRIRQFLMASVLGDRNRAVCTFYNPGFQMCAFGFVFHS